MTSRQNNTFLQSVANKVIPSTWQLRIRQRKLLWICLWLSSNTLMKNKISLISSDIRNFNNTILKLHIDEKIFNRNLRRNLWNLRKIHLFWIPVKNFRNLWNSDWDRIQNELYNLLNAITFEIFKIMHTSLLFKVSEK